MSSPVLVDSVVSLVFISEVAVLSDTFVLVISFVAPVLILLPSTSLAVVLEPSWLDAPQAVSVVKMIIAVNISKLRLIGIPPISVV